MKTITILHPFTPQAAGVVEASVPQYHSQPHAKALMAMASHGYVCTMEYFTPKWFGYSQKVENINYRFYPVSFTLNGDHKKWKKQRAKACLKSYTQNAPDVTIINMSGHSSPFSYDLSKVILKQKKQYIAMLGGRHYSEGEWQREYYKNAHHILVHTEMQKQQMKSLPLFQDLDIRVLPLGVETDKFTPNKHTISEQIRLLYVGRISELKRVHLAMEVVEALLGRSITRVILHIVGPVFSQAYFKQLKQLVASKNLEKYVVFEGLKSQSELISYFQNSDILLLPSSSESFGMVVIEAMACAVPAAVIKGVTGPEEIITPGEDGIITNPETYVSEVLDLLLNKDKLQEMKKKARQKVVNKFSIEETIRVLSNSIDDALKHE